jgi:hypothetical protein
MERKLNIYSITSGINLMKLASNVKKVSKACQIVGILLRLSNGIVIYDIIKLVALVSI